MGLSLEILTMGRHPHRGADNDRGAFAKQFIVARLAGFEKDIRICLTPTPSKTRSGMTHAYFPALSACCALLEYLTVLYRGRIQPPGWRNVYIWATRYMPSDYDQDKIRILVDHFRNSVAHRGIATGVWIDQMPGPGLGRRLTWKVCADTHRPSIEVRAENKQLLSDPPWPCSYTHRVHIHLKSLAKDIRQGALLYADEIVGNQLLQDHFFACMRNLYPK
jgi:hypothetical protein